MALSAYLSLGKSGLRERAVAEKSYPGAPNDADKTEMRKVHR